jgi:MscS family membrane protein
VDSVSAWGIENMGKWLVFLAVALGALFLIKIFVDVGLRLSYRLFRKKGVALDAELDLVAVLNPIRVPLKGLLFSSAMAGISLAIGFSQEVQAMFIQVSRAFVIFFLTGFFFRLLDIVSAQAIRHFEAEGKNAVKSVIGLGRRSLKVVLSLIVVVVLLENWGFNVTAIVAGLGVGGIAIALASQKTIENFFGGLMLSLDQPVRVGDFCRFGEKVGVVEDIGLRTTKIRTLDRTLLSIPNGDFSQMQIENFAKRERIRLHTVLGLRYETTPDQLRYVLIELKKLLLSHPKVDPEPARVRFNKFGAYSLDIDVFAFVLTSDWTEFLGIQEDIFLRIIDVVDRSGSGFAFPSQTTYLEAGSGINLEKKDAAEAEIKKSKEERDLLLPTFPPERINEFRSTLTYPDIFSAVRKVKEETQ